MRHELLRLEHVTKLSGGIKVLDDFSLMVLSGEHVQVTGLSGSGIEELGRILAGQSAFDSGRLIFDGKSYGPGAPLPVDDMGICSVFDVSSIVPQLTVAENIFTLKKHSFFSFVPGKRLINSQAKALLDEFGLDFPPDAYASSLSPTERKSLDFIKAYARGAKLVIAHGAAGPYPEAHERLFDGVRQKLLDENISVISISSDPFGVFDTYERTIVLRDGCRAKTIYQQFRTRENIMRYAVSGELPEPAVRKSHVEDSFAFRCFGLNLGQIRNISFGVRRGEILGVFDSESDELSRALDAMLTGSAKPEGGYMLLAGGDFRPRDISGAVKAGMGYINGTAMDDQLVEHMSMLENVMLPSLPKAPKLGIFRSRAAERNINELLSEVPLECDSRTLIRDMPEADVLDRITILYHRWGVYRPKLLLYNDPFAHTDAVLQLNIIERIEKLTELGIGVLILSPRLRDHVYLCDRILVYRNGSFVREHSKNEGNFKDLQTGNP